MKAFFHRLHIGGTKDKDKESSSVPKEKLPPLRTWPPEESQRATTIQTQSTYMSFKPLPEVIPSQIASQFSRPLLQVAQSPPSDSIIPRHSPVAAQPPVQTLTITSEAVNTPPLSRSESDSTTGKISKKPTISSVNTTTPPTDVQKKVAFLSPPPTPAILDRDLPEAPTNGVSLPAAPLKTTVSRFQATHGKEPRGPVSAAASSSKTDVGTTSKASVKATSTRTASPYLQKTVDAGSSRSLRSGTPYSQMSNQSSGSRILAAQSWSEVTEDDLVSNIGSRERTRQEVLFEIISSEERYVQELIKMKSTFIDPLLHPFSVSSPVSPSASTPNLDYDYYRSESPYESVDDLPPIAARFMSPSPTMSPPPGSKFSKDTPNIDDDLLETDEDDEGGDHAGRIYDRSRRTGSNNHHRSPYHTSATRSYGKHLGGTSVPFPSRSHQSLPPPPRGNQMSASTHSLGRQSIIADQDRERKHSTGQGETSSQRPGVLRKFKKSQTAPDAILGDALAPHQLPEDLRICLQVIDSGVFDGHKRLSEALKKRYDDQFPLVRSLADVFVSNSDIFHGYATYVIHLERALDQVDAALSNVPTKKPKRQDVADWQKVCKVLKKLEEDAAEKGETGLAITLSKPFQRLLKYPLLFQNLLFHTDPSTYEYESTLQMVAEVETIVRSIEDEKIQKEERDKTRDVFARIEGLDKVRQLAQPKPSRILIEERACPASSSPLNGSSKSSSPPPVVNPKGVRGKSSFKRLSDVLHSGGMGGKKDLWFVVFNDVVLQCQRTGTTSLPLVAATNSRTTSLPDLQGKAKYATTGRRNSYTKPRNLYKFIKIETWAIGDVVQPREGVVSMEDVAKAREMARAQPRIVPMPDDDDDNGGDSDDSDKKSKMSFSYWGADKITVQKPIIKGRPGIATRRPIAGASYGRESSANAKFGSRLVSDSSTNPRPSSRRTHNVTPSSRRQPPPEENYAKATVTRPAWDTSTRTPLPPSTTKRTRNTSQASATTRATTPAKAPLASPAPSEDSGVGLYRQMLANESSFN